MPMQLLLQPFRLQTPLCDLKGHRSLLKKSHYSRSKCPLRLHFPEIQNSSRMQQAGIRNTTIAPNLSSRSPKAQPPSSTMAVDWEVMRTMFTSYFLSTSSGHVAGPHIVMAKNRNFHRRWMRSLYSLPSHLRLPILPDLVSTNSLYAAYKCTQPTRSL